LNQAILDILEKAHYIELIEKMKNQVNDS